jgi:hypothetical protein
MKGRITPEIWGLKECLLKIRVEAAEMKGVL